MNKKDILPLLLRGALSLLAAILAGVVLLTAVYALPTARMRHNVSISLPYILSEGDRYQWAPYHNGTELDGFTDAIMLGNAIYAGSGSPLGDALVNPRMEFTPGDSVPVDSLSRYAQGAEDGRQVTYARYWHGYLVLLKPLLLFFSLSDIRMMNAALQLILAAGVLLLAFRKRGLRLALPMGLALLVLNPVSTALSMQFSSIYYLTLLGLLIMLLTESWDRSWGYLVFLFLGIGTAFFDFLTYPACAVGTCLALQALMSRADGKTRLLKTVGSGAAWAFGYGGMWSGKWLAASLITGNSVMRDAVEQAQYRSGGEVTAAEGGVSATFGAVLSRNLGVLANPAAAVIVLALLGLLVWLLVTKRCRFALERASLLSLAIAFAVPFVWYFLLRNHSLVHCWMTYRNLSAAVFALSGGLCFGLKGNGSPEN